MPGFSCRGPRTTRSTPAWTAACTAATETIHAPPDPRLGLLADHQTLIDQITDDIAKLKNRRESCREEIFRRVWKEEIARLKRMERSELKRLVAAIRQHDDLARRLDLIASVDGVGLPTAGPHRGSGPRPPPDSDRHPGAHARDRPRLTRGGGGACRPRPL